MSAVTCQSGLRRQHLKVLVCTLSCVSIKFIMVLRLMYPIHQGPFGSILVSYHVILLFLQSLVNSSSVLTTHSDKSTG